MILAHGSEQWQKGGDLLGMKYYPVYVGIRLSTIKRIPIKQRVSTSIMESKSFFCRAQVEVL